jgi:hypothetical protein
MLEGAANPIPSTTSCSTVDAALSHPWAFVFMAVLMLGFGLARVAKESNIPIRKWRSFLHLWMAAYVLLLTLLMSLTTAMSLVLLVDACGPPRVSFIPPSFISVAAAVLGVFGFEFLVRKFVIGFGENQLDVGTTLQNVVDQAVAATLKKEVG